MIYFLLFVPTLGKCLRNNFISIFTYNLIEYLRIIFLFTYDQLIIDQLLINNKSTNN